MASVNLVCAYIRNRRWDLAIGALEEIRELGRLGDNSIYQAKAVVEIIGYTEMDKLDQAQSLYESLDGLGDGPEFNLERMRAAGNLIYAAGEHGRLDLARRVYDTLGAFGDSEQTIMVKAAATINLMSDYGSASMIKEAEELFGILEGFDSIPELAASKAQGAFNLMCCYIRKRRFKLAEELYGRIRGFGDDPQVTRTLAHATFGLATEYLKIDHFEEAVKAYGYFNDHERSFVFLLEQVKAMYNLVQYCCDKGLRTMANEYYQEFYQLYSSALKIADSPEDDLSRTRIESYFEVNGDVFGLMYQDSEPPKEDKETELCEYLSDAGALLVSQFAQNMRYKEASEVFATLKALCFKLPVKPVVSNALQASFELVIYLMGDGHAKRALKIFNEYDDFPKEAEVSEMVEEQRIQSGLHIIENTRSLARVRPLFERLIKADGASRYGHYLGQAALRYGELLCEARDYQEARKVYEQMASFGDTKRLHLCRLQLAVLLLDHYLLSGDRESAETLNATLKRVGRSRQVVKLRDQATRIVDKIFNSTSVIRKKGQPPEPQSGERGRAGQGAESLPAGGEGRRPRPAGRSEDS
jgi:tetratricopeptide (TPR) repeat protein